MHTSTPPWPQPMRPGVPDNADMVLATPVSLSLIWKWSLGEFDLTESVIDWPYVGSRAFSALAGVPLTSMNYLFVYIS